MHEAISRRLASLLWLPFAAVLFTAACGGSDAVAPPTVTSIAILPTTLSVPEAKTLQLSAATKAANGSVLTGHVVKWTSSNVATATVSDSGLVTAILVGTTDITATSEGISNRVTLTVTPNACSISLAKPVVSGVAQSGTLATTDCEFGDDTFLDLYTFTLAAQQTVDVTMKSTVFDAYLFIYRVNANDLTKVGENDDENNGPGTDARLSGTLSAGSYVIVANGFNVSASGGLLAATGAYTLSFTSPFTAPLGAVRMLNPVLDVSRPDALTPTHIPTIVHGLHRQR